MGETKGAISHTLAYLHKKGLIRKFQNESNDKEVLLFLSNKGRKAFMANEDYHRTVYGEFKELLRGMPEGHFLLFNSLLEKIDSLLRRIRKNNSLISV